MQTAKLKQNQIEMDFIKSLVPSRSTIKAILIGIELSIEPTMRTSFAIEIVKVIKISIAIGTWI